MKLKLLPSIALLLLITGSVFAQSRVITYHKMNGQLATNRDSAYYERIVTKPDSGSKLFNVTENYMNGKPKIIAKSTKIPLNHWEGPIKLFYPTGILQRTAIYKNNRRFGEEVDYYPNGKVYCVRQYLDTNATTKTFNYLVITCNDSTGHTLLKNGNGHFIGYTKEYKDISTEGEMKDGLADGKWTGKVNGKDSVVYTEQYQAGTLVTGSSTNQYTKQTYIYTQRFVNPHFDGGDTAFYKYLRDNIRYPADAKMKNIQGKVYITFAVDKDGTVCDAKVMRAPSADLGQEALNVINLSPNWSPGLAYGQPVKLLYTVPIGFSLHDK